MASGTTPAPAPAPAPTPSRVPDALLVPIAWRGTGATKYERADAIMSACEPLLGVGRGQATGFVLGPQQQIFVVKSSTDTLLFRSDHPTLAKQPRYTWEPRPDIGEGVLFGFLKPEARAELEAKDA